MIPEDSADAVGVICDLDGTLAHTAPSIHRSGQLMLEELGLPGIGLEESVGFIGDGLNRYIKRMLTGNLWGEPDPETFSEGARLMRKHYAENLTWQCELFPGVERTLGELADTGCRIGCVTNKPEGFARRLLEHLGIMGRFPVLVGGDTLDEKKPHPKPVVHCLERLGVDRGDAVFVGDGAADSKACRKAGVYFVAVEYGYNRYPVGCEHFDPDRVIGKFVDMIAVVDEMRQGSRARCG